MALQRKAVVLGDLVLALFNVNIREFDHLAAVGANEVVMVITVIELKNGLATVKLAARQDACLLKLSQHTVDSRQANIDAFADQHAIDIFGTEVPLV